MVKRIFGYRIIVNNSDRHRHNWDELDQPIDAYGETYDELINNIAPLFKRSIENNKNNTNKFYNFVGDEIDIFRVSYIIYEDELYTNDNESDIDPTSEFNKTLKEIISDIREKALIK